MATGGQPQAPDNRIFLFRLQILVIDGGLLVLRNKLDQSLTSQCITFSACLNQEIAKIKRLKSRGVITQVQYDVLFPAGGKVPTLSDLDITLIICLLKTLKCFGLNRKFDWNATPSPTDVTIEADIWRLKDFRNKISHISTTTAIQQNDFTAWWNDIEQILVRQSSPAVNIQQTIAKFKTIPLDLEEERRIQEEIKKWKDYEADVDRLKQEMTNVKENVTDVKKDLEGVKKNVTEVKKDLEDIKENDTVVKRDVEDIKENVTDMIKDLGDVKENYTVVKRDLEDVKENVTEVKKNLEDVKENDTGVKRALEDIKENVTEVKKDIEDGKENDIAVKRELEDMKEDITVVKKDLGDIYRRQWAEKSNETDSSVQTEERKYQNHKKELKYGLIEFYKTRHSKVFLSPLFEENDTPLASFYIRPELNLIISAPKRNDEEPPVISLLEMFKTGNQADREIHVIADAGLGKTAFSNYLAITWCQAHFPDEDMTRSFEKTDIVCMQGFDFLFLVLLRDANDLCSIDDLIFKKIVLNLGLQEKPAEDFLLKILKNEKCLVILDGLDEWTHPEKECHRLPRSIPHRNDREKCTILTTTRPWKLGVLNLNSCQIGKKVELTKLSYQSAFTLTNRILQRLKSHANKDALQRDVIAFLRRQNDDLTSVPLLLIYTICLLCDGVQIGNSKCELYINIVEMLLSRTIQKHGDLQQVCDLPDRDTQECFADHENCTKYYPLLVCLGKLAYYTLFNETKENTLVFDGSVAKKYLSTDEMKFILHSGMLSESTTKTLTKKFSKVSFSHKTVQEFFAAIFISSENEAQKIVLEKCRNDQDILDMAKIYEFMCEMNADRMSEISKDLMAVVNDDQETCNYRTRTGYETISNTPLYNMQKMFMSCLQEMPESENIQLCLQDFFIDVYTVRSKQLQHLLKQNKANIKSLHIGIHVTSSRLREIIDLFSLTDLSHIQKLDYHGDSMEEETEIYRILFPSLQNVTLTFGKWINDEENLARCQNLQYLYIHCFTLSHKMLETLFNFISGQKSMKELTLWKLNCKDHGDHGCKIWSLDLSQHSTLSKFCMSQLPRRVVQLNISTPSLVHVTLWLNILDEGSLLLSRNMVNIERVKLYEIFMSPGSLHNFISVLENLPQAVTVVIRSMEPYTEFEHIRENIRSSQTFHVIQDTDSRWESFEFKKQ